MTQVERVVAFVRSHPGCSTMELQLGLHPFVSNPRARISDARAAGHVIDCRRRGDGERGYVLIEQPEQLRLAV